MADRVLLGRGSTLKQDVMNMASEILREAALEEGDRGPPQMSTAAKAHRIPASDVRFATGWLGTPTQTTRIRLPASAVQVKPPVVLPPLLHAPQLALTQLSGHCEDTLLPGHVVEEVEATQRRALSPPPFSGEFSRAQAARESNLKLKLSGVAVEPVFKNPATETWQPHPAAFNWGQGWEVAYQQRPRVASKTGPAIRMNRCR